MGLYRFQISVHLLGCTVVIEGENSRYGKDTVSCSQEEFLHNFAYLEA